MVLLQDREKSVEMLKERYYSVCNRLTKVGVVDVGVAIINVPFAGSTA